MDESIKVFPYSGKSVLLAPFASWSKLRLSVPPTRLFINWCVLRYYYKTLITRHCECINKLVYRTEMEETLVQNETIFLLFNTKLSQFNSPMIMMSRRKLDLRKLNEIYKSVPIMLKLFYIIKDSFFLFLGFYPQLFFSKVLCGAGCLHIHGGKNY